MCSVVGVQPLAFNYNAAANTDDGSCIPYIYGCTDPTMFNYCDTCNTDDGSCIPLFMDVQTLQCLILTLANADNVLHTFYLRLY